MGTLRLTARLVGVALLCLILVPSWLAVRPGSRPGKAIQRAWYRGLIRLAGLRVERTGAEAVAGRALMVANHASYLDILVFGALFNPRFVAKADVRAWPGIGRLAAWAGTVFVDRRRASLSAQADAITAALERGERLLLFPEGTSGDNAAVLPIKSSLFQTVFAAAAEGGAMPIQPVMIAYLTALDDGAPLTGPRAADYAWVGEATLVPHVLDVLRRKGARVRVEVLPPVTPETFASRKELAQAIHARLSASLERARGEAAA